MGKMFNFARFFVSTVEQGTVVMIQYRLNTLQSTSLDSAMHSRILINEARFKVTSSRNKMDLNPLTRKSEFKLAISL